MDPTPSSSKQRLDSASSLIHGSLCPRIAIVSSPDVDEVLRPNGFTDFAECLAPFEDSVRGVTVRTLQLESKQCPSFPVRFEPLTAFLPSEGIAPSSHDGVAQRHNPRPEELLDIVTSQVTSRAKAWDTTAPECDPLDPQQLDRIRAGGPDDDFTPWFTEARDTVLASRTVSKHETFGHPAAVILAVSTRSPDPMNAFASLYATTQPQSCEAFSSRPYVDPNVLRYYVLIHDESQGIEIEQSMELLASVKKVYGHDCCVLPINSAFDNAQDPATSNSVSDIWATPPLHTHPGSKRNSLVGNGDERQPKGQYGAYLNEDDVKRLRAFVRELVAQSLIPWMERCVSHWNESVTASRKGLTGRLFGAGRKFFGQTATSKAGTTGNSEAANWNAAGGFYYYNALGAQTRRLADFAFMVRDYKLSAATYDVGRKDYANDKALRHAAGATEMFGLSHLMMMMGSKTPPIDVDSYLAATTNLYRSAPLDAGSLFRPLRAALLYYEAYRALRFYRPAPLALIRAADDSGTDLEVVGAMLLEQAAYSDLRIEANRPAYRKWAMHMVMAGHRYQASGAKVLCNRCFRAARNIYWNLRTRRKEFLEDTPESNAEEVRDKFENVEDDDEEDHGLESSEWSLIRIHIEQGLGAQALADGQADEALEHLLQTLRPIHLGTASASQDHGQLHEQCLRNFLSAYAAAGTSGRGTNALELPRPLFVAAGSSGVQVVASDGQSEIESSSLRRLENMLPEPLANALHNQQASNVVVKGESFSLLLQMNNPLWAPLAISDISVTFIDTSSGEIAETVRTEPVTDLDLEPGEERKLEVQVHALSEGKFRASKVSYRLAGQVTVDQELRKEGRRLNDTVEQRRSKRPVFAPDMTLAFEVQDHRALLQVDTIGLPSILGLGEEVEVKVRFTNVGKAESRQIKYAVDRPDVLALRSAEAVSGEEADNRLQKSSSGDILGPHEVLAAGATIEKDFVIRGAATGPIDLSMLFAYETSHSKWAKIVCLHNMEVHPVIDVGVETNPAQEGLAYNLLISILNVSSQSARVTNVQFISPRWQNSLAALPSHLPRLDQTSSELPSNQSSTAYSGIEEANVDSVESNILQFSVNQLQALIRGRDIDRSARPPHIKLCSSSASDGPAPAPSSLYASSRSLWRARTLAQMFPVMTQVDRERIFTLYQPDDLDVIVHWEQQSQESPERLRRGQVFIFGLSLGPSHNWMGDVFAGVGLSGVRAGERSMYEETAKRQAALLDNLRSSPMAVEEDPLVVDIEVASGEQQAQSRVFPVTFRVRNMSTLRYASCIIDLDGSIESDLYKGTGAEPYVPKAAWIGRLTLRSDTVLAPRETRLFQAKALRPVSSYPGGASGSANADAKDGHQRGFELGDWSIKVDVRAEEKEQAEVVAHFNSGRLRSGKFIPM